jgi:hypothetical protein
MEGMQQDELRQRRSRAVRTAWVLALVAALIFVAFILSGVLGS